MAFHRRVTAHHPAAARLALGLLVGLLALFSLSACDQAMRVVPLTTPIPAPSGTPQPLQAGAALPTQTPSLAPSEAPESGTPATARVNSRTSTPWLNEPVTAAPSLNPSLDGPPAHTPTITRTPSRTTTYTRTPTVTFTPTPPGPSNQINRPGMMSKVVSPIQVEMYAITGEGGKITLELVGEDGRVISRQVISRGTEAGRRVWLAQQLPFEILAAAETARLQVITYDGFGREVFLTSVDLILLSVGRNEINPPGLLQAPYLIRRPAADEVVSGGVLVIEALARPVNDSPLIIELVRETGRPLVIKQINVPPPEGALSHTPFTIEIPYRVSQRTPIRLVFRQEGSRIPGTLALFSRLIILEP